MMKASEPDKKKPSLSMGMAHALGLAVFLVCRGIESLFPSAVSALFSLPAAWLTALFFSSPLTTGPEGIVIHHPGIHVEVTGACSGFTFFSLLLALLTGMAFRFPLWKSSAKHLPLLLAAAWGITILLNSARMVSAISVRLLTRHLVPESYQASLHLITGMLVLLPALILLYYGFLRYCQKNQPRFEIQ